MVEVEVDEGAKVVAKATIEKISSNNRNKKEEDGTITQLTTCQQKSITLKVINATGLAITS